MKKIRCLFPIIFILFAVSAFADFTVVIAGKKTATYCSSCPDAANGGDQICEIPDGSADGLCGWTVVEAGGETGDINLGGSCDNSPALGCAAISMDYCVSCVKVNTSSGDVLAYFATSETTHYVQFYVKILSEGLANSEDVGIFSFAASTSYASMGVGLQQDSSGDLRFVMYYHVGAGWVEDSSSNTVSTDTWYGIRLYLNDGAGATDAGQWWVDWSNNGTWTNEGAFSAVTLDRAIVQYQVGNKATTKAHNFILTGLKIDNDTMPDSCAR